MNTDLLRAQALPAFALAIVLLLIQFTPRTAYADHIRGNPCEREGSSAEKQCMCEGYSHMAEQMAEARDTHTPESTYEQGMVAFAHQEKVPSGILHLLRKTLKEIYHGAFETLSPTLIRNETYVACVTEGTSISRSDALKHIRTSTAEASANASAVPDSNQENSDSCQIDDSWVPDRFHRKQMDEQYYMALGCACAMLGAYAERWAKRRDSGTPKAVLKKEFSESLAPSQQAFLDDFLDTVYGGSDSNLPPETLRLKYTLGCKELGKQEIAGTARSPGITLRMINFVREMERAQSLSRHGSKGQNSLSRTEKTEIEMAALSGDSESSDAIAQKIAKEEVELRQKVEEELAIERAKADKEFERQRKKKEAELEAQLQRRRAEIVAKEQAELEKRRVEEARQKQAEVARQRAEEEAKRKAASLERKRAEEAERYKKVQVEKLLRLADADLASDRLTTPPGESAFARYQAALAMDPGNDRAIKGLRNVANRYLSMANEAAQEQNFDIAKQLLSKAESISPGSEKLALARTKLNRQVIAAEKKRAELAAAAAKADRERQEAKRQAELKRQRAEAEAKRKKELDKQRLFAEVKRKKELEKQRVAAEAKRKRELEKQRAAVAAKRKKELERQRAAAELERKQELARQRIATEDRRKAELAKRRAEEEAKSKRTLTKQVEKNATQKQVAQSQPRTSPPFRVGFFSVAGRSGPTANDAGGFLEEYARDAVERNDLATYIDMTTNGTNLWRVVDLDKEPDIPKVYSVGNSSELDAAYFYWFNCMQIYCPRMEVTAYLIDIQLKKVYRRTQTFSDLTSGDIRRLSDALLSEFKKDRAASL